MLKTFLTNYIRVGLSVQCLSSAILQQWTIGRQSQAMACLQPRSSCSLFKVDKEMNDASLQRCWLCVTPPDGLKKYSFARLELWTWCSHIGRKWLLLTGLPGAYCAPHPSISDTSMWDKSIMCLCNNCDNVWTIVSREKDTKEHSCCAA